MMSQAKRIPIDDVEELEFYVNNIKKFHTKEFITKFILKNMSEYPEWRFMEIIEEIIDRAFRYTRSEGAIPELFSMVINSETLDTPIYIPLRSKKQNNVDLIMNGKNIFKESNSFICFRDR